MRPELEETPFKWELYIGVWYLALNPIKYIVIGRANLKISNLNSFQFSINVIATWNCSQKQIKLRIKRENLKN